MNGSELQGFSDVVRLEFSNGWVCSGVFLNQTTVLTAAHCLVSQNDKSLASLVKIESFNNQLVDVKPTAYLPHPNFRHQKWHIHDVGLIKTTKNSRFERNFEISRNSISVFGQASLYGCGKENPFENFYSRTWGWNSFVHFNGILFFKGRSALDVNHQGFGVSVAPNDSGGPIVDKVSKKIIGIMTTTTLKKSLKWGLPTIGTGTSIVTHSNMDFILKHTGEVP